MKGTETVFTLVPLVCAILVGAVVVDTMWRVYTEDQIGTIGIDSVTQVGENKWVVAIHGEGISSYTYEGEMPEWVVGAPWGQFVQVEYNMRRGEIIRFIEWKNMWEYVQTVVNYLVRWLILLVVVALVVIGIMVWSVLREDRRKKRGMRRKKRRPNLMSLPYQPTTWEVPTDTFISEWCCNCGLRHVVHVEVRRGKTKKRDSVVFRTWADELGTKLGRMYLRRKRR